MPTETKIAKINKIISKKPYKIKNGVYHFLEGVTDPTHTTENSVLGKIQEYIKKKPDVYNKLISIFSPVMVTPIYTKELRKFVNLYSKDGILINVGSGPGQLLNNAHIIEIDQFAFQGVDMVADATSLPIKSSSVDAVISVAVLEHVERPDLVIDEAYRTLKTNGSIFCYVPFIVGYHAAPNDYYRWTKNGLKQSFSKFKSVKIFIGAGPTSGMLWIVQEWLALVLSFGIPVIHDVLFIFFMALFSPLKLLDIFLWKLPNAEKISSCFFVTGKK